MIAFEEGGSVSGKCQEPRLYPDEHKEKSDCVRKSKTSLACFYSCLYGGNKTGCHGEL